MIDRFILWALRNRVLVLGLAVGLLAWGTYVTVRMPVDVLPDLTAPTVTVLAEGRGMAPTDMESLVTFPIEAALNGAAGVRRVRSATAVGVAVIWVEFEWGEDIYRARQTVAEKLNVVADDLPPEVESPVLAPVSSIMGEVLFVALESDRHSPLEVRTTADTVVRRRLLAVPGVSQVTVTGGGRKQYQVVVSPGKLAAHNLSVAQVEEALGVASRNTSAGFRVAGGQEYLIQGLSRIRGLDDIRDTVLTSRDTRPVLVRDVADVVVGEAIRRGDGSHNGSPAVILGIQKQPEVNTLELTSALDTVLEDIQASLPVGLMIERNIFRQADFIEAAIANLTRALRDGTLLVVVIVLLFMANVRATGITLLAIPLSLMAAVIGLKILGATINSMTLGGMAIAIGALVDDAIITVENVFRRLKENAQLPIDERVSDLDVVYRASTEIRSSIVFATIIIMLVFLPLFFLADVEGRLLQPLGLAYLIALFVSLVVALSVTPVLCLYLLSRSRAVVVGDDPRVVRGLKHAYERLLPRVLDRARPLLAAAALLLAATAVGTSWLGQSFLPEFNEGVLTISAVTLPGVSLEESDRLGASLERLLLDIPEVTNTARRTGRAELDEHVQGVEAAEVDVQLRMGDRSRDVMLQEIRDRLSLIPGTNVTIGQPISHRIDHMLSGTRANIAVKVFGKDLGVLRSIGQQIEDVMNAVPGVVDLSTEQQTDIPTIRVRFDRLALARYGLPAGEAASALETALLGRKVGRIFEGGLTFPLVLRYPQVRTPDLDAIRQTLLDTPAGAKVPLVAVAEVAEDRGPNFISREGGQRKIVVMCNVAGRDLRSIVNDIQERVTSAVQLPQGYRVEYGGQFESEAQASQLLFWLGLAVVAGILFTLWVAFQSWTDAAIIMVNLPLALIGGIVGVFVSGGVLSVASLIGLIALLGIATRNGIMLVSHIKHVMEHEGVGDFRQAIIRGSVARLSPVLMTALSTGLALVPVAMGVGESGSEIQAPMAIVIIFGLLSSTVLNMLIVPAAYWAFAGNRSG